MLPCSTYWIVYTLILEGSFTFGLQNFINVEYLLRVNRLNNLSYNDYYFVCNGVGSTLLWESHEESLIGFSAVDDVGEAVVSTGQNFNYTSTLLKSHQIINQQSEFTSVLIISLKEEQTKYFNVTCSNGLMTNTINTSSKPRFIENLDNFRTKGDSISLKQVLSAKLIHNSSTLVHILTCGTANLTLTWGINGEGIVLDRKDEVGDYKKEVLDGSSVSRQAILFARQPFKTTSVMFVTSNSNINVTCSFGLHKLAMLHLPAKPSDLFSEALPVSSTNSATLSTAKSNENGISEFLTSGMYVVLEGC